ncbi:MAG: hypothetical protein HYU28_11135 [Actinobacteria bacterium]|nr:hypothetical protein [Actinomycetota bacterium]
MVPARRLRSLAVAGGLVLALTASACSQDSPEQELPCEYWVSQFQSGGVEIDKVPSEFKKAVEGTETCDEARARAEG